MVLLVEDDDAVRALTRRMLEMQGLTVHVAPRPEEALHLAAGYGGRIDVLLTDIRLPGMDGPELADRLRAARPDVRVVFISGGLREDANGAAEFLPKPFTPAQLAATIRRVLAAAPTTPPPAASDTQVLPGVKPDTGHHMKCL